MSPAIILIIFLAYTALVFAITWITSRKADSLTFFTGNKISPWYVVAYGMIGASLSGVTFISVSGQVKSTQFSYMVLVTGYLLGYLIISLILLPLYYRLNLISIYSYLEKRFGFWTYKTGAGFFMLSRIMGASLRMFVVINVLQLFVFDSWGVPFWANTLLFITLIILYTLKGGIKTIVWTDTLQTTFMLAAAALSIYFINKQLHLSFVKMITDIWHSSSSRLFNPDWKAPNFYLKHFLGGIFIAISMTGLDQEMMQKNLSCRNLKDAQKNMLTFSLTLFFVNMMFLILGAVLLLYAQAYSMHIGNTDELFPVIAIRYLGPVSSMVFLFGLISAAYPSADGALTSLTTSFCIDFMSMDKRTDLTEKHKRKIRYGVHLTIAFIFLIVIVLFKTFNDRAIIDKLFTIATYTYGPLLGFFSFGLFTKRQVFDKWVPGIALLSPLLCFVLSTYSQSILNGYRFGYELLIVNGTLTFLGMFLASKKAIPLQ